MGARGLAPLQVWGCSASAPLGAKRGIAGRSTLPFRTRRQKLRVKRQGGGGTEEVERSQAGPRPRLQALPVGLAKVPRGVTHQVLEQNHTQTQVTCSAFWAFFFSFNWCVFDVSLTRQGLGMPCDCVETPPGTVTDPACAAETC